ncbi:MAG: FG-GAP-like repeat-containing protein [Acidobacteriia bacterium]|nr:FG-GAP-like repeat-containing protein [Terriglobia bacterium]
MNMVTRSLTHTALATLSILALCLCPLRAETFKNPKFIPTGTDVWAMNVGDFNNDGKLDFVYLDSSFTLHVLLGNGDGTFRDGQDIPLPVGIGGGVAVRDINQDGKLDIVLGGGGPQAHVGVLLGNGDGTFQPIVISTFAPAGTNYAAIGTAGIGDVNGDGKLDLVVTDALNDAVYVLLGDGTGAFTLKSTMRTGAGEIFMGDFNGDGREDFVIHERLPADAVVFFGNGDGTFQSGVTYHGPDNIGSLLMVDMDGDGHPDMVIGDFAGGIDILHGNPDGTFAPVSLGGTANFSGEELVEVADLNGDGILDIVGSSNLGVSVLLGTGQLAYKAPVSYIAGTSPGVFTTGDFNHDGRLDFAVAATGGIAIFLTNADGTLNSADSYTVTETATGVAVADFNGDHIPDIAVGVLAPNPRILLGKGDGTFQVTPDTNSTTTNSNSGTTIYTGDFDGDGKADLILGGIGSNGAVIYGNGDGTFTPPVSLQGFTVVGFTQTVVGDFNRDHKSDVVITNYSSLEILLGQANRTFKVQDTNLPAAPQIMPAVADFNNDGIPDLVSNVGTGLQILLGNGDGTFRVGRLFSTELPGYTNLNIPNSIAAADLDGDGNIDIVAPMSYPYIAEVFYGKGDGTFDGPFLLPLARAYTQIAIADLNKDGKPDLVLSDTNLIAVIHNEGNRKFGPEVHYLAGPVGSFTVQDLNGDGFPDIVVANGGLSTSTASTVTVLLNQPTGSLVQGTLAVTPEPSVYGAPINLSVSVAPVQAGSGTPSGTVTFELDGAFIATVPLQAGSASFVVNSSPGAGQHTIYASYSGDATFLPSTFTVPHVIVPLVYATTTTLSATPNPALASRTVRLTAMVTSPGPLPNSVLGFNGVVAFHDGATDLGIQYLNANGQATFDTSLLSAGTHSLTATYLGLASVYPGNLSFASSTSSSLSEVVTANSTTTSISVVPASAPAGGRVTLSATVTSPAGTPTGAAVFYDGSTILDVQPLDVSGNTMFSTVFANAGTHSISAMYLANGTFASSKSGPLQFSVTIPQSNPTTMVLVATPDAGASQAVRLTASLKARPRAPSGIVIFSEGNERIGQATITSEGNASYLLPALSPGMHYISAWYAGEAPFGPSSASIVVNTNSSSAPDFRLSISPASASVGAGQTAAVQVNVKAVRGFDQDVTLSCFTGQASLSCSLQPTVVRGGNGNSSVLLTASQTQSVLPRVPRPLIFGSGAAAALLAAGLFLFGSVSRLRWRWLPLSLCILGASLAFGCGALPMGTPEMSVKTQAITVVASSQGASGLTHTAQIQVTFKQN